MCKKCEAIVPDLHASLEDWTVHILTAHHDWLYREFPLLLHTLQKLKNRDDCPIGLEKILNTLKVLKEDLDTHMAKEERILFPLIRLMEVTNRPPQDLSVMPGTVVGPIHCMEGEHETTLEILNQLGEDLKNCTPVSASHAWSSVVRAISELAQNIREHIDKENTILFPRARQLEEKLLADPRRFS